MTAKQRIGHPRQEKNCLQHGGLAAIISPGQQIDLLDILNLQRRNGPEILYADVLKGHKDLFDLIVESMTLPSGIR